MSTDLFTAITLNHYLALSGVIFMIGMLGVMTRRNIIIIFMSLELMLNAANLALVAFAKFGDAPEGYIMVFFIITVAAAEVAVGLALITALFRLKRTVNTGDLNTLKF